MFLLPKNHINWFLATQMILYGMNSLFANKFWSYLLLFSFFFNKIKFSFLQNSDINNKINNVQKALFLKWFVILQYFMLIIWFDSFFFRKRPSRSRFGRCLMHQKEWRYLRQGTFKCLNKHLKCKDSLF